MTNARMNDAVSLAEQAIKADREKVLAENLSKVYPTLVSNAQASIKASAFNDALTLDALAKIHFISVKGGPSTMGGYDGLARQIGMPNLQGSAQATSVLGDLLELATQEKGTNKELLMILKVVHDLNYIPLDKTFSQELEKKLEDFALKSGLTANIINKKVTIDDHPTGLLKSTKLLSLDASQSDWYAEESRQVAQLLKQNATETCVTNFISRTVEYLNNKLKQGADPEIKKGIETFLKSYPEIQRVMYPEQFVQADKKAVIEVAISHVNEAKVFKSNLKKSAVEIDVLENSFKPLEKELTNTINNIQKLIENKSYSALDKKTLERTKSQIEMIKLDLSKEIKNAKENPGLHLEKGIMSLQTDKLIKLNQRIDEIKSACTSLKAYADDKPLSHRLHGDDYKPKLRKIEADRIHTDLIAAVTKIAKESDPVRKEEMLVDMGKMLQRKMTQYEMNWADEKPKQGIGEKMIYADKLGENLQAISTIVKAAGSEIDEANDKMAIQQNKLNALDQPKMSAEENAAQEESRSSSPSISRSSFSS